MPLVRASVDFAARAGMRMTEGLRPKPTAPELFLRRAAECPPNGEYSPEVPFILAGWLSTTAVRQTSDHGTPDGYRAQNRRYHPTLGMRLAMVNAHLNPSCRVGDMSIRADKGTSVGR